MRGRTKRDNKYAKEEERVPKKESQKSKVILFNFTLYLKNQVGYENFVDSSYSFTKSSTVARDLAKVSLNFCGRGFLIFFNEKTQQLKYN